MADAAAQLGGSLAEIGSSFIPGKSSGSGTSTQTGTGSSTGTTSDTSPFGQMLGFGSFQENKQIQPLLDLYITSAENALTKGSLSGAGIPMAQAAIAQARGAAGATLGSAENFLARSGGADSPFAGQLLSGIAAQGNEATAQAPVDIYKMILGQIPGFASTILGQSYQGLAQAGALNRSSSSYNTFNTLTKKQQNEHTSSSGGGGGFFGF